MNLATRRLYPVANTPAAIAALGVEGIAPYVKSIGLWQNKAKNVVATCRALIERHGGEVPADRAAAKEAPLNFERVNISEIIQFVNDEFSPQLVVRQIGWFQPTIPVEIVADRLSMVRVFRNFIDNALKYGGDELSQIRIEYDQSGDCHIFSVSDDGVGVKDGDYERIFALFQRDESARAVEGAGLGLAIVKEIAERRKGSVWAEPAKCKGTTFRIAVAKNL